MPTAIRVEGLTKRFGDLLAVAGLDLEVREGEIFGLLGPNGAGKTTAIRMMTGMLRPTSGKVFVGEAEIRSHSEEIKRRVGVCPQDVVVWERLTCGENLALIGRMYGMSRAGARGRAGELLEAVGLAEKRDARAKKLSGGMKKRLNLAMALVHDPDIVVLDEPITGLDPQSRLLVSDYIRGLCRERGKTIILTTHLMEVASNLSDRIAIMDHGKLLVLETLEELKRTMGRGDVVEVALKDGAKTGAVLEMMRAMDGVDEATERDGRIRFQALGAVNMLPDLFRRLHEMGVEIEDLSLHANTLEDIFISLTGRGLRD